MRRFIRAASLIGLAVGIALALGLAPAADQQKPAAQKAAATRVPISFTDFHGYTGTVDYLKKVAAANPGITELIEIGRSNMDRPIHVLVVSNMKTGTTIDAHVPLRNQRKEGGDIVKNVTPMKSHQGKPAQWIDGGTHGNEFTGTEVCLYIIDRLISGYGTDADLTKLVDENTFYICPIVNPDGVFNSVERAISQRGNSMRNDDDKDGTVNEDGPDDLNGDGVLSQFRYKDPKGRFVVSDADPRVMVRLAENETTTKERYSVITEDRDNDGDGRRGEDGEGGIDVNRNFPEGWFRDNDEQGGSGAYPSSSPEARAVLEFFTSHTNILLVQSYHTSGGFTYRPMARYNDTRLAAKDLAIYDRVMGKKYLELIGEPVPAAWTAKPGAAPEAAADGASEATDLTDQQLGQRPPVPAGQVRRPATPGSGAQPPAAAAAQPRGWRHPYNDQRNTPYGYGVFLDWGYAQFGSWAMSTELWNWQRDTKGVPGFAGEDDRVKWEVALIAYQEKALGGRAFIPWKAFKHPELGEGEIGGWVAKYGGGNAIPGESLAGVCETHWQFELFKAKLLPRLEITDAKARVLYTTNSPGAPKASQQGETVTITKGTRAGRYKVVEVTVSVANTGGLPTHLARGATFRGNRQDVVWLIGDRDRLAFLQGTPWVRLGTIDGTLEIPGYQPPPAVGEVRPLVQPGGPPGPPGGPGAQPIAGQLRVQRPEPPRVAEIGNTREVTWLVAIDGDSPLKVVLTSQKGGTRVKDLSVN